MNANVCHFRSFEKATFSPPSNCLVSTNPFESIFTEVTIVDDGMIWCKNTFAVSKRIRNSFNKLKIIHIPDSIFIRLPLQCRTLPHDSDRTERKRGRKSISGEGGGLEPMYVW